MNERAGRDPEAKPHREPFLTLPNLLTLSRLPMAALIWLRPLDPVYVLGIMALAGLSDVLDGWVERRRHPGRTVETVGAWLDPLCDKLFVLSVLTAIAVSRSLPLWIVPLVALREILQTLVAIGAKTLPLFRKSLRFRFGANILGKATTVLQFITIGAILLNKPGQILLALTTAGLGLIAVAVYVGRALHPETARSPVSRGEGSIP
ncbi:MAG TPA: CDP-alcohol phosphatidyltransferase family protein [Planctomycetota bacterium]|nr:CDP-alcohol phosphatidyltransferase family protein [Planctomycetota bacterium]